MVFLCLAFAFVNGGAKNSALLIFDAGFVLRGFGEGSGEGQSWLFS